MKQPEFRIQLLRKLRRRRPGMNFATAGNTTGGTGVRQLPDLFPSARRRLRRRLLDRLFSPYASERNNYSLEILTYRDTHTHTDICFDLSIFIDLQSGNVYLKDLLFAVPSNGTNNETVHARILQMSSMSDKQSC